MNAYLWTALMASPLNYTVARPVFARVSVNHDVFPVLLCARSAVVSPKTRKVEERTHYVFAAFSDRNKFVFNPIQQIVINVRVRFICYFVGFLRAN